MSKEKELTADDYRDAAERYHYASPAGEKERWEGAVQAAVRDFSDFWSSDSGVAAREMLAKSGKVVSFTGTCDGTKYCVKIDSDHFIIQRADVVAADTPETISAYCLVWAWCAANRGELPKAFLNLFKAELKKIHDEAPGKPQGEGVSECGADSTAGCKREH